MKFLTRVVRGRLALITAVSFLASQNAGLVVAQTAKPAATAKSAAPTATQVPVDGGWPRAYTTGSGAAMVLYQPQVASWDRQKLMTAVYHQSHPRHQS